MRSNFSVCRKKQKLVLIALSKSGSVRSITAGSFVRKYGLSSASSVQSAVKGLLEKDFITYDKGLYSSYDLFLAQWIKREY